MISHLHLLPLLFSSFQKRSSFTAWSRTTCLRQGSFTISLSNRSLDDLSFLHSDNWQTFISLFNPRLVYPAASFRSLHHPKWRSWLPRPGLSVCLSLFLSFSSSSLTCSLLQARHLGVILGPFSPHCSYPLIANPCWSYLVAALLPTASLHLHPNNASPSCHQCSQKLCSHNYGGKKEWILEENQLAITVGL